MARDVLWVLQALVTAFLAILFLQSGLDKALDRAGNRAYIGSVFEKTPLRRFSGFLYVSITLMEVFTGILSAAGCLSVVVFRSSGLALVAALLASVTFLSLFFGQRIAKDYAGAAGLVPYFLVSLVAVAVNGA